MPRKEWGSKMSIINSYDESEEIVKAEIFTKGQSSLPDTAIVCFKKELIDFVASQDTYELYSSLFECGEEIPLYHTNFQGKDVIIYRTWIGGPATVTMMEELASRGVKNFIIFGSCGLLTNNLPKGTFILPTEAYRDEGVSYHYIPASDFVNVNTASKLVSFFEQNQLPYICAKTWTNDALYRETTDKVQQRIQQGCQVVEMECASVMAMCQKRNLEAYYFLYSDDTLDGEKWDLKTLKEDRSFLLKECLKIALKVARKI